jgi:hypothetical protein
MAATVLLLLVGCATIQTGTGLGDGRFEFGLIGDQQYTPEMEAQFPNVIEAMDAADLAFVVHDGDFKAGATPCSDATFIQRKEVFQTSKHPFVYTPGDNEWTDCHAQSTGSFDPRERLAKLRELFFQGNESLGRRTLRLTRQSEDPQYAKFRENVRWVYGGVLFVTLHVVGSNNNLGRTRDMDAEYAERNAADLVWLRQAFELAKRDSRRAIMLIAQANPGFENRWDARKLASTFDSMARPPEPKVRTGFDEFLAALEVGTLGFGRPVVLVHGDTHHFRIDKPLVGSTSKRVIENFTRVETFGSPDAHWVRVIVDPSDPNVFTFKPEIVKKNLVTH